MIKRALDAHGYTHSAAPAEAMTHTSAVALYAHVHDSLQLSYRRVVKVDDDSTGTRRHQYPSSSLILVLWGALIMVENALGSTELRAMNAKERSTHTHTHTHTARARARALA